MTKRILLLNGPNLNLLGTREPHIYGSQTLADVEAACKKHAKALKLACDCHQSNTEGELVNWIQEARQHHAGIILNAGAYTHTSVAIRDALIGCGKPVIEVHISNIFKREEFRHHSYISDVAAGLICGLGTQGYLLAIDAMATLVKKS